MTTTSVRRWRPTLKRLLRIALLLFGIFAAIVFFNLWRLESRQLDVPAAPVLQLADSDIIERFSGGIPFKTISQQNPARTDTQEFERFKSYLEASFPRVHNKLIRFTGDDLGNDRNLSLLYRWEGSGGPELDSVLLMAHYDVVPVEPVALERWTHPPFSGYLDEQYVWGRGTLDVKNGAIGLMEAVDLLLEQGFRPKRTIYISLGHDEEVGGVHGNKQIAEWLRSQGIRLEFVLDEGGCIYEDFVGLDRSVALVGVAEKGYVTARLIVESAEGGHSSMPPKQTAIGILAEALHRLHEHPFPRRLDGGAGLTLDFVGPEMPLANRIAIGNRWLFSPLIKKQIAASPAGNASLQTTMAPTMTEGGVKENVLPTKAELTINVRILPGDRVDSALDHMKRVVNDERVNIQMLDIRKEPSRMSSTDSEAFAVLHRTIKEIFPNVVVAPFVVVGGTDASHFDDSSLSKDVYRFIPSRLAAKDIQRIHGIDERIAREDYLNIVRFYVQLLKNAP